MLLAVSMLKQIPVKLWLCRSVRCHGIRKIGARSVELRSLLALDLATSGAEKEQLVELGKNVGAELLLLRNQVARVELQEVARINDARLHFLQVDKCTLDFDLLTVQASQLLVDVLDLGRRATGTRQARRHQDFVCNCVE